jgi:hypothetical protein
VKLCAVTAPPELGFKLCRQSCGGKPMSNAFAGPLIEYWARLYANVHPDDEAVRGRAPKELNFDYPPPAFIGDVGKARIFVLMGNGGYSDDTKNEFAGPGSADLYRSKLANPAPADPRWTAPYYLTLGVLSEWLRSGRAAIVNALAYRSLKTTNEVAKFAQIVPFAMFHRRWFEERLYSAAVAGEVRVAAHRPRLWGLHGQPLAEANIWVLPSDHSARRLLSKEITDWLSRG